MASMAAALPAVLAAVQRGEGDVDLPKLRSKRSGSKRSSAKESQPQMRSMSDDTQPIRKGDTQRPVVTMPDHLQVAGSAPLVLKLKAKVPTNRNQAFQRQISAGAASSASEGCGQFIRQISSQSADSCSTTISPPSISKSSNRKASESSRSPNDVCRPTPFFHRGANGSPAAEENRSTTDTTNPSAECLPSGTIEEFDFDDIVHDMKKAMLGRAPAAQVVLVCSLEPQRSENLTVLGHENTEMPAVPSNSDALLLAVENTPECVERAQSLLRSHPGNQACVVVLLQDLQTMMDENEDELGISEEGTEELAKHIEDFMGSGAHDAIICSHFSMNVPLSIAISLSRARMRVKQQALFSRRVQQARQQCHELFWKNAHITIDGFPEMKQGMREVQGKSAGNMTFDRIVGKGAFGQVYQCSDMKESDGELMAVKVFSKAPVCKLDQLCTIASEYFILAKLAGHPNVVAAHSIVHGVQNIYIFMDYAGDSSLYALLRREESRGLAGTDVNTIFQCVADGLAHCHELRIAHCDIKPENVVLAADGLAKLVDFGEAEDLEDEVQELTYPIGTMPFISPEILKLENPWNPASSDVWALGVLLLELMCGENALPRIMQWNKKIRKPPVPERGEDLLVGFAFNGPADDNMTVLEKVADICREAPTPAVNELLAGMLQGVPEHRLTAGEVARQISQIRGEYEERLD